jgi:hypothetical protein
MSKVRNVAKQTPGKAKAVHSVHFCHNRPLKVLYKVAEAYPAKMPIITNNTSTAVAKEPRLAGDKNPAAAKINAIAAQSRT